MSEKATSEKRGRNERREREREKETRERNERTTIGCEKMDQYVILICTQGKKGVD